MCLSHAMWSRGGLAAKVMLLPLRILQNGEQVKGIKEKYVLSDGGKADNTGLTPLVERGVDLIVLSQIAGDPKIRLGDIKIGRQRVKRLFDVDIGVKNLSYPHPKHQPLICESDYAGKKKIVFVKLTPNNIDDFYDSDYCKNKFVKYLLGCFIGHGSWPIRLIHKGIIFCEIIDKIHIRYDRLHIIRHG